MRRCCLYCAWRLWVGKESVIKKSLVLFLIFLLRGAGGFCAGEADVYGHSVKTTPYDQKSALIDELSRSSQLPTRSTSESIAGLFRQARNFSYRKENHGDVWQSPQVTEKMQAGDCEDKALWLYARLRAAGYGDIKLVVGKYRPSDTSNHVWLMYTEANRDVLILDPTIQNKAWSLSAFQPKLYRPFFSFDDKHHYSHIPASRLYS